MSDDETRQARFQLGTPQIVGAAVLMGIAGGLFALGASALAGSALVAALRRRLDEMEVAPTIVVRQNWARAKAATTAGLGAWHDGQAVTEPQPA